MKKQLKKKNKKQQQQQQQQQHTASMKRKGSDSNSDNIPQIINAMTNLAEGRHK